MRTVLPIRFLKVAQGKRLAEFNYRPKEKLALVAKDQEREPKPSQAYGIWAVIAVGLLGYYIFQRGSPGDNNATKVTPVESVEVQI